MTTRNWFMLILFVVVCELIGGLGALSMGSLDTWYTTLVHPALNPPSWVFGPAWTILYALMGIAAWFVVRTGWQKGRVRKAIGLFAIQLALNAIWSPLFFGLHNPLAAYVDLVLMWIFILLTILAFRKVSRTAAWLMAPYLAWVTFAGYLNLMIVLLN